MSEESPLYPLRKKVVPPIPEAYEAIKNLLTKGHIQLLMYPWDKKREMLGLEKIPPVAIKMNEAMNELSTLARIAETHEKIYFDPKRKEFRWRE